MKNHFVITLEIETILSEEELYFAHDNNLGIIDGDTEIRGFIATTRIHLSNKNSPEKNSRGLRKAVARHIEKITSNMLKND